MVSKMLRSRLVEPERVILEEVEKPAPRKGEVLVQVATCGICGSDIHAYYGRHPFIKCPIVQGHEFSGIVTELGEDVKTVVIGQRVTVIPHLVCGKCYGCQLGRSNLCENLKFTGCQSSGAMAEYLAVPSEMTVNLPEEIDFEEGALIEPLAVGVHALRRSNLEQRERVLIYGAGPIGLLTLQVAKAKGAGEIIIVELSDLRLKKAKELGASYIINPSKENVGEYIKTHFPQRGVDLIFECVGANSTIQEAVEVARKGTQIVVVGVFGKEVPIKMGWVQDHELDLLGSCSYLREDFREAIELIQKKKVNVKSLITNRFPLTKVAQAYKLIEKQKDKTLKVLLQIK